MYAQWLVHCQVILLLLCIFTAGTVQRVLHGARLNNTMIAIVTVLFTSFMLHYLGVF